MKVSDYIVQFFIRKGVTDVFGYPGGMVTHLMDSFSKYEEQIQAHVCYHEQAASFEACAYAQASNKVGVAYATSGPGATNMITGVCNAYFDSVPVIFITGQVNTFESKAIYGVRQRGFQETDIVAMVKDVTKYAVYVESPDKIGDCLEKAYQIAMSGRKGPVLLDIPMDVQRSEIEIRETSYIKKEPVQADFSVITDKIQKARKPCVILGAALKGEEKSELIELVEQLGIPVVTSMISMDLLPYGHPLNFGYIGAYGTRKANFVVAKSDFLLILGSRMDVRQVGGKRGNFAPGATIIRVDIDKNELEYQIRNDEIDIQADVWDVIKFLKKNYREKRDKYAEWIQICNIISEKLGGIDDREYNFFVDRISQYIPDNLVITTDVGQNQVWIAQSYRVRKGQRILFSGGHGAMGYSLPAAIGAYYASRSPVISFNGDGGIQMNIQELAFIRREKLPVKIFVFNNFALGMIRHFQEMYFDNNYYQTVHGKGYEPPDFKRIAEAYEIPYIGYESVEDVSDQFMQLEGPVFVEIKLRNATHVYPKLEFGKENQDQEPLIDRELYNYIMELDIMENSQNMNGGGYEQLVQTFCVLLWFSNYTIIHGQNPSMKRRMGCV